MYIIATYIIGFILCIIGNVFDRHTECKSMGIPFFVCGWTLSPLLVPIVSFTGFLCIVGIGIKYLTDKFDKALFQEEK